MRGWHARPNAREILDGLRGDPAHDPEARLRMAPIAPDLNDTIRREFGDSYRIRPTNPAGAQQLRRRASRQTRTMDAGRASMRALEQNVRNTDRANGILQKIHGAIAGLRYA